MMNFTEHAISITIRMPTSINMLLAYWKNFYLAGHRYTPFYILPFTKDSNLFSKKIIIQRKRQSISFSQENNITKLSVLQNSCGQVHL